MNVQQVGAILSGGAPSRSQSLWWTLPPRPTPLSLYLSFTHSLSSFSSTLKSWKEKPSQESALICSSIKTRYTHTCVQMLICTGLLLTAPFPRQDTFNPLFLFKLSCPSANWVPILWQLQSIRTPLISFPAWSVWSHCATLAIIGAEIRRRDCQLFGIFDLLLNVSKEHLTDRKLAMSCNDGELLICF